MLVAFPFSDLSATKVRPALVLSSPDFHRRHRDCILAAISSVIPPKVAPTSTIVDPSDPEFAGTGLRVKPIVHCGKLVTVQGTLVRKYLGSLGPSAMGRVDVALGRAVGLAAD